MKTSTILTLSSFLASTLAVPTSIAQPPSIPYSVTDCINDRGAGGSPGCVYSFNIISLGAPSSNGGEPPFETHCTGTTVGNQKQPCDAPRVVANKVPGSSDNFTLRAEHV